jgi:hypothetical protein
MQFIYALVATYTLVAIVTIWQRDTYQHVRHIVAAHRSEAHRSAAHQSAAHWSAAQ